MNKLKNARETINKIDKEMASLFEQRMDAVKVVSEYKKENGLPVDDLKREEEIIQNNSALIKNDEYKAYYINFFKNTIKLSKAMQHKLLEGMTVGYSGTAGAFANIAAKKIFPDARCVPYPDFKAAYTACENGECDCVILPVENSYNGDVGNVLDLAFFGSLYINGIYEAEIIQNLLGVNGATINDIKTVISHPQALGQCADYIEKNGFFTEESVNTAIAANTVAMKGDKSIAAIASEEAAERFGLSIIASHINKSSSNTTRFAVFSRSKRAAAPSDERFIMLFTVKNQAGSLGSAISVIGQHGFNLRALKSRPTKELTWDYYFYAEGEGNIDTPEGCKMLKELSACCADLKVLGTYQKEIHI